MNNEGFLFFPIQSRVTGLRYRRISTVHKPDKAILNRGFYFVPSTGTDIYSPGCAQ